MQFQREPRRGGYPGLMDHWPSEGGNVYISGYGFIHLDPDQIERHEIRRSASLAGGVMLCLTLLPAIFLLPGQLAVRYLAQFIPVESPDSLVLWTAVLTEVRNGLWQVGSYLVPILFLLLAGGRDLRRKDNTTFSARTFVLSFGCALGLSAVVGCGGELFSSFLSGLGLIEAGSSAVPTVPAAHALYVVRVAVILPVLQELLLRGLMLRMLRKYGDAFALFITALMSGLTAGTLNGGLCAFVMGLMYGYLMLRTGLLSSAALAHVLCVLWPALSQTVGRYLPGWAAEAAMLLLLALGLASFALICRRDENAFILSSRALDYGRMSGAGKGGGLPFRKKLAVTFGSAFFSAASALCVIQIIQRLWVT